MAIKILFSSPFTEIRNSFLLLVLRIFTLFQRVETVFLVKIIKKSHIFKLKERIKQYSTFLRRGCSSATVNRINAPLQKISANKYKRDDIIRMPEFYIPLPHEIIDVGKGHQLVGNNLVDGCWKTEYSLDANAFTSDKEEKYLKQPSSRYHK